MIQDAYQDSRFFSGVDRHLQFQTKNIICSPLINRNRQCIGALEALNKDSGDFTEDDTVFLSHIAQYASLILEYRDLHKEQEFIKTAKERVINHLSHELKTPLAIIASVIEHISRELQPHYRERLEKSIHRGQRNIKKLMDLQEKIEDIVHQKHPEEQGRMLNFIQNTMDFIEECKEESLTEQREVFDRIGKRIESLFFPHTIQLQKLFLETYFKELCLEIQRCSNFRELDISQHVEEDLQLSGDTKILEKIFSGLLKNAIENTPDQGRIDIRARSSPGAIRIDVQDYGIGITEHNQRFIFSGFFHTQDTYLYSSKRPYAFNAGGAGVDLLRIKALAEQHAFTVAFQSARCRYIPGDSDQCAGRISKCPFISQRSDCFVSGGSTFSIIFNRTKESLAFS